MKNKIAFSIVRFHFLSSLFFISVYSYSQNGTLKGRIQLFDSGWRFAKDSLVGVENRGYDDSHWRRIDLPHDWSIEDLPNQKEGETVGPFSKHSIGGAATGNTVGGTGWYRKSFTIAESNEKKLTSIYFEGAYMETDVWVNGNHVGTHKNGYTSFYFDITKYCRPAGERNVIAVRVLNRGKNSRWYSGSGIYRHVKLITTNPLHFQRWGNYVTTPQVSDTAATIHIQSELTNATDQQSNSKVRIIIRDASGKTVAESRCPLSIQGNENKKIAQDLTIKKPALWSFDNPNLYAAEISILEGNTIRDVEIVRFGIRLLSFSATDGFRLNNRSVELRGGCMHHDNGILGAAAIDRAEERKIELLKAYGFNAVRCSHNPPSEKFLETCDRLGMLVVDEAFDQWQIAKNPDDYHKFFDDNWQQDFSSMILRDRNHPSIILWSVGNEIPERAEPSGTKIVKGFKEVVLQLDPSRLITEAVNDPWDHPGNKWDYTAPAFSVLDVGGYNYQWWEYENDHKKYPERIMMGTESVPQHAFQNWNQVEKKPFVIGDFVWTAMDYLGEAGIGHDYCGDGKEDLFRPWPWFNANCGDIDLIGNKKPQSFYRDIVWRRSKIEMAVHAPLPKDCKEKFTYWGWPSEEQSWTWPGNENNLMQVNVYSRASKIRLLLNGKLLGDKNPDSLLTAKFEVPYQPGELKAVAMEGSKQIGEVVLVTSAAPARLRLKADRIKIHADKNDLSYITVQVVDNKGRVVPNASIPIQFHISGGEIAAVGNANPTEIASFQQPHCKTFRGRCLVILRPASKPGTITLEATGENLPPAKILVTAK